MTCVSPWPGTPRRRFGAGGCPAPLSRVLPRNSAICKPMAAVALLLAAALAASPAPARFLVLTQPRSGSTYLVSRFCALTPPAAAPGSDCVASTVNEPLGRAQKVGSVPLSLGRGSLPLVKRLLGEAFAKLHASCALRSRTESPLLGNFSVCKTRRPRAGPPCACGFKVMYSHLPACHSASTELKALFEWLGQQRVVLLHLTRKAHINRLFSERRMQETGVAHVRGNSTPPRALSVHGSAKSLAEAVLHSARAAVGVRALLDASGAAAVELDFDDFTAARSGEQALASAAAAILPLLGQAMMQNPAPTNDSRALKRFVPPQTPCSVQFVAWPELRKQVLKLAKSDSDLAVKKELERAVSLCER